MLNESMPRANVLRDAVVADPRMLAVIDTARAVAAHTASVLIIGETGVGKELVARVIHQHSPRAAKPWVDINCSALPEHLVESELFGYERGAFSGADTAKPGLFEIADGGTLFLDEIGDLDPKIQAKLLRVLDGTPYYRLGGSRKVSVDVRVVAATNRNLDSSVQQGAFRRDLFHRIGEIRISVPPLRDRPADILALARHFLQQRSPNARFTPGALECLLQFEWQGNVRELRNLVLKLVLQNSALEITAQDVQEHMGEQPSLEPAQNVPVAELTSIAEMERAMIVRALELSRGNQTLAAVQLGMPRRTFCRKLNQLQIPVERRHRRIAPAGTDTTPSPDHRKKLNIPISIITARGHRFEAESSNLSAGGLGLRNVQPPLSTSEQLTLAFMLPGSLYRLEVRGIVAWSRPDGAAGIRFVGLDGLQTDLIQQWIAGIPSPFPAIPAEVQHTGPYGLQPAMAAES
jgi:two-component system, NtrC family, response regulator AtoC